MLASLQSEISRTETAVKRELALHCSSSLLTLKLNSLNHVVQNLERFESFFCTSTAPFEQFNMDIKEF